MAELKNKIRKDPNRLATYEELQKLRPLERVMKRVSEASDWLGGTTPTAQAEELDQQPYVPANTAEAKPPENTNENTNENTDQDTLKGMEALYKNYMTETRKALKGLKEGDKKFMQSRQDLLKERLEEADNLKDEQVSQAQMLELAQILGQAFAQIGAAAQGLQTGRRGDIKTRFNPQAWNRQYDRILNRYDERLREIRRRTAEEGEPGQRERQGAREQVEADMRARWALLQDQLQDARLRAREAAQSGRGQAKQAAELAKERQKTKEKYAKIRSELFKYDEDEQDKGRTIAKINQLLGGRVTPEQLDELTEQRGGRNIWNLWLDDSPDKFKKVIDRMEEQELEALTPSVIMKAPDGTVGTVPASKIKAAEAAGFKRVE